jgi:hypothetical protein
MNNPFVIVNILDKQMEPLSLCPDFFSKENGARLSIKRELLRQMMMSKSELSNFFASVENQITNIRYQKKVRFDRISLKPKYIKPKE